uniref:Secreted protein n=1 Tax=Heterorhabditis bacteriophora TaxID=37862 RepID=A0A1I7XJM1_HETBA
MFVLSAAVLERCLATIRIRDYERTTSSTEGFRLASQLQHSPNDDSAQAGESDGACIKHKIPTE